MITIIQVEPRRQEIRMDREPTLAELQGWVGGLIEEVYSRQRDDHGQSTMQMVINEEGKLRDLPFNPQATAIARHNGMIDGDDYICGPAVLLTEHNRMT